MAETFTTQVAIQNSGADPQVTIRLNAPSGTALLGGNDVHGHLVCFNKDGDNKSFDQATIHLDGQNGRAWLNEAVMRTKNKAQTIYLNGEQGNITVGANGQGGNIVVQNENNKPTVQIDGSMGNTKLGGQGANGALFLRSSSGQERIRLDAGGANLWVGGNGADGDIVLFRASGDNATLEQASIHLDGDGGNIFAGGQGVDGDLVLRSGSGQDRIRLDADSGNLWVGGNGADGDILLFPSGGDNKTPSQATIHLNGDSGDIILQNADCAEDFEVEALENAEPGTVMVISDSSRLRVSYQAYDQCVAGIVAGAGKYRPGIILGRKKGELNCLPIALMGRVYCKVDADPGAIKVGDLLTSSSVPGYAMKASDPLRAFGAVIGKALDRLDAGRGLIPVLVTLQ